jgi:hypothetical protein
MPVSPDDRRAIVLTYAPANGTGKKIAGAKAGDRWGVLGE